MRTRYDADERLLVQPGDDSRGVTGGVLPVDAGQSHPGPGVPKARP